jgi:hypothetical protein
MTVLRLLIDQMIDVDVAAAVEALGHDVRTVGSYGLARADDAEIIRRACDEGRTLVTLDEHFGDWAVLPLLEQHADRDFTDQLVIVRRGRTRWIKTGTAGTALE